ncbi:septum site-determining protein MinC [Fodinicurvata sp. EGI_FJ10296]|uniref:septum site-determining protein MinC n=1 Tax=Fodinicurvata sp. EGI_FJ10296 TaxID=3231908 RepID=UPI00345401FA
MTQGGDQAPDRRGTPRRERPPAQTENDSEPPFRLLGGAFTMMVLRLNRPDDQSFFPLLLDKIEQAPDFFRHAPVVLDIGALPNDRPFNFAEFMRRLRQHNLIPVGVQNGTDGHNRMAAAAGLSLVPAGRPAAAQGQAGGQDQAGAQNRSPAGGQPETAGAESMTPTKLVVEPIRSGRQIYANGGDLVAMSSVSSGAEILADGHIHIYGSLRGRALAGVTGDATARIFCQSFDPELVSIAGYWLVRDDIAENLIGRPVQCRLEGEALVVMPLEKI